VGAVGLLCCAFHSPTPTSDYEYCRTLRLQSHSRFRLLPLVLHAIARAKNIFWGRPCLSVCLSHFLRRWATWMTGTFVAQKWEKRYLFEYIAAQQCKQSNCWRTLSDRISVRMTVWATITSDLQEWSQAQQIPWIILVQQCQCTPKSTRFESCILSSYCQQCSSHFAILCINEIRTAAPVSPLLTLTS
jgi:hypothetical protein